MKPNDSDLIHEYNATKRLGNPATAAPGDAKQLRNHLHDTTNVIQTIQELTSMDLKSTNYKQMVDGFCDTLAIAEDMFNEEEITKALIEAIEEQRDFYRTKEKFYNNLITTIKFKLNER